MIQKRINIFETNSSSVHAIVISMKKLPEVHPIKIPGNIDKIPKAFSFKESVYSDPLDKLFYLCAAIQWYNCFDFSNINSWIRYRGIRVDNELKVEIDSPGELIDFMKILNHRPGLIDKFIFNPRSRIYTGFDGDENSIAVKIIKRWTPIPCSTLGWVYYRSRKIGGDYYIYGKGN